MQPNKDIREERSLTGLFTELTRETTDLVRHEVALAKNEISEKITQAGTGLASLAFGAMVAYAGILVLLWSAVLALSNVLEPWLAALLIGLAVALVGMGLLAKGRSNLKAKHLAPHRTAESLRRDKDLAKEHIR